MDAFHSNKSVKASPSGRWTLRDKAPRSAPYLQRSASCERGPRNTLEIWSD